MTDNIEETKRKIAIMRDYTQGYEIIFGIYTLHKSDDTEPSWDWETFDYATSPEEKVVSDKSTQATNHKISVMQAYVEGRKVGFDFYGWHKGDHKEFVVCDEPSWNWHHYDYRIIGEGQNHDK